MDPKITKLAISKNLAERKEALSAFLADNSWSKNKRLTELFLEDPDEGIKHEIGSAVLNTAPVAFMTHVRMIAVGDDQELREEALKFLATRKSLNNVEIFLQRIPFEEAAVGELLKAAVDELLQQHPVEILNSIFTCLGSSDDKVREEALGFFVKCEDKDQAIREFLSYVQASSPSIRERLFSMVEKKLILFATLASKLLETETKPTVRMQAINLLKAFNEKSLEDILLKEMNSEDWLLSRNSMQYLAEMKSEKAKPILIEAMDNQRLTIQAIAALDKYRDQELAIVFISRLPKAGDQEQLELLRAIKNISGKDARFIEPLIVFAGHEVAKEKAKDLALEIAVELCERTKTIVPKEVQEIKNKIKNYYLQKVPDLDLKVAED